MTSTDNLVCGICGNEIGDHISTEYILNGNHLSCEIKKINLTV
jgi:hypothetical protein